MGRAYDRRSSQQSYHHEDSVLLEKLGNTQTKHGEMTATQP